ncbi:(Fe-S)-binding protein [Chitinimonas lacunae]|uniref:(Fe-S)-binding protein n=1 Tax=Chitinimonas lacunae TaxID=1963018 RepID=A0ABV8MV51_9NEIS
MRVGLYVTCLVDLVRPSVGWSALQLLESAGCEVVVPEQTCCGQPAYNSGERELARALARQAIEAFADCDYVVLPSGSCASMMKRHYPALFSGSGSSFGSDTLKGADDSDAPAGLEDFCRRVYELTDFLVNVLHYTPKAACPGAFAYHDSCSGLRDLAIKEQPRQLLRAVAGAKLTEMVEAEQCCGFGGTFSAKFPDLSCAIADRKCAALAASGADALVGGDLGCLLHLEGRLRQQGRDTPVFHIAEVLAGRTRR